MVEMISENKNLVVQYMRTLLDKYGKDKMAVDEVSKLADIVKDLAEAEKECWEAEYYRSVSEAMGRSGYTPDTSWQYDPMDGRRGYNPNRDSMGRYARRGYGMGYHDGMEGIRQQMQQASPEEREKMKRELRQMLDM